MPSSSDLDSEQNFLEQWMSNVSRAGVLLKPTFHMLDTKQNSPLSRGSSFTDSLNEEFFHEEHHLDSGYGGRLEFAETEPFAMRRQMLPIEEVSAEWENGSVDFMQDDHYVSRGTAHSDPLLQKLEQLKELQQQKQEQLKRQQMEQLQRLMEEQKKLLTMVSVQPTLAGFPVTSEQISHRSGTSTNSAVENGRIPHLQSNAYQNMQMDDHFSRYLSSDVQTGILPTFNGLDCSFPAGSRIIIDSDTEEHCLKTSVIMQKHSEIDEYRNMAPVEIDRYENDDKAKQPIPEHSGHEENGDFITNCDGNNHEYDHLQERPIVPVISKQQSFEEFLEEQMRLEEQRLKQTDQKQNTERSNVKNSAVKRPFLKRGEGIARFKNPKCNISVTKEYLKIQQKNAEDKITNTMNRPQMLQRKTAPSNKQSVSDDVVGIIKKIKTKHINVANQKEAVLGNQDVNNKSSKIVTEKTENKRVAQFDNLVKSNLSRELDANKENIMDYVNQVETTNTIKKNVHSSEQVQKNTVLTAGLMCEPLQIEDCSFDFSFQKRYKSWETEKEKEHIELDEFLLLEDAAEDLSFSSNSSFVQKLLRQDQEIVKGHRLSSTPVKVVQHQKEISPINESRQGDELGNAKANEVIERASNFRTAHISPKGETKTLKTCITVSNPTLQDTASETSEDEDDTHSNVTSDSEDIETTLTNEKEESKQSEKRCEDNPAHHDYGVPASNILNRQNKSRDLDLDLSVRDENCSDESTVIENERKPHGSDSGKKNHSLNVIDMEFDDEKTWADLENDGNQSDIRDKNTIAPPADFVNQGPKSIGEKAIKRKVASIKKGEDLPRSSVTETNASANPSSNLMIKLFPSLKSKPIPDAQQRHEPTPNSIQEPAAGDSGRSQILKEKLAELETEIERFKVDNASLAKLRAEQEKAVEHFRKELADFEQRKVNELAQIEEYKKEEMKKLQKERKVFEKYATAARAIPDKKERDEIQALKQQLADLQEELKRRELKWSTTHSRLRNQIETVTKENAELREEVRVMEKFRLEVWKKAEAAESNKKTETNGLSLERNKCISTSVFKSQIPAPIPHAEKNVKLTSMMHQPHTGKSSGKYNPISAKDAEDSNAVKNVPCNGDGQSNSYTALCKESNEEIQGEIAYSDGKVEKILKNGCHVILFPNGTRKETSPDGKSLTVTFFNGDVKRVLPDQTVIYYFADAQTTHTTYPNGLEVLHFSNGQIEKHFPDGKKEITFPDQTVKNLFLDGREESIFPDGTIIRVNVDGSKIIEFDNGQREVHTSNFKRREYPDGTVKTVYNNGHQETKFTSGRVRIKDRDGNVIKDTK